MSAIAVTPCARASRATASSFSASMSIEEQIGAFARERERERAADAGRRAGHQRLPAANDAHRASRAHD